MSDNTKILKGRRRWFLGSLGAVTAGAALASASTQAANAGTGFQPMRHSQDAWLDAMTGSHRAFLDSSTGNGGMTAMNYANNLLVAHTEDYGGKESDYALVICFRHGSTPLGFNDAMWAKYGANLSRIIGVSDRNDQPFMQNPLNLANRADFPSRGFTLEAMASRGIRYAVCSRATRTFSGMLARGAGMTTDEVYAELAANIIADGRMVPAGVTAATRAQEYGFSLLYSG